MAGTENKGGGKELWAAAGILTLLVWAVYGRTAGYSFVIFDDPEYVYRNPMVLGGLTGEGIAWAFGTFHFANWHPLTWISHMAAVDLFGVAPAGHHLLNAFFHWANTLLLLFVLKEMTGRLWESAFVAALFGVHPLHVESVAWISERKDVLSTCFWILAMGAYLRYVRRPGTGRYLLVAAAFALGLLVKPMLVTLPFVFLLLDFWPLGRLSGGSDLLPRVREKIPLLALSAASCVLTVLAQSAGDSMATPLAAPFGQRVANAFLSVAEYLGKTVWPSSLAVIYPHPFSLHGGVPLTAAIGGAILVTGITVAALRFRKELPWIAVGWFWYLGTLVPVIGLVQVGSQGMADRYTYVPLIGIFVAVAWGLSEAAGRLDLRKGAVALAATVVLLLCVVSWRQAGYWKDSVTLFERAVSVTEGNWIAMNHLGMSFREAGDARKALEWLGRSAAGKPDDVETRVNLGAVQMELGMLPEAIASYREALRTDPGSLFAWVNLGNALTRVRDAAGAEGAFREALRIDRNSAEAWTGLAFLQGNLGRDADAAASLTEAARLRPDDPAILLTLAYALERSGRPEMAADYRRRGEALKAAQ